MYHNVRAIMYASTTKKFFFKLENSLIASSSKRKDSILHVPILSSSRFTIYTHICVAGYAEQSEMQDPGHLDQRMKTVFSIWFHHWQGVSQEMGW